MILEKLSIIFYLAMKIFIEQSFKLNFESEYEHCVLKLNKLSLDINVMYAS